MKRYNTFTTPQSAMNMTAQAVAAYNPFHSAFIALTCPNAIAFYKSRAKHDAALTSEVLWAIIVTLIALAALALAHYRPASVPSANPITTQSLISPAPARLLLAPSLDDAKPGITATVNKPADRPLEEFIKLPASSLNKKELLYLIQKLSPRPIKRIYSMTRAELDAIYATL